MAKPEIYCMTDIEADGKFPGFASMLSFATAAFDLEKNLVGTFDANLQFLDGAQADEDTMKFWNESESNKKAYSATRVNPQDPLIVMERYQAWLKCLPGTPIFVGYPAAYDFKWIDYYTIRFLGTNPYSFSRVIDVKSLAWSHIGGNFLACTKRNMPNRWFDNLPHTHVALDDAIEQGAMFINMTRDLKGLTHIPNIIRN